ncbi:MAG: hypothetical protein ACJAX9_000521 [Celeribacter sp.]|jgi:hypothetical protein
MHKIFHRFIVMLFVSFGLLASLPAVSQERQNAGVGRLFSNDFFGDGQDRWHTMSYALSVMRGPDASGVAPEAFGRLVEHRLRSEVIAPENLTAAVADRPYAGVLSYGLHSHSRVGAVQSRVGLDVVALGPQTGIGRLHSWVHDGLNSPRPDLTTQLPNAVYPTLSGEMAQTVHIGDFEVRPFAEAQYGVETFTRLGADIFFGTRSLDVVRLRDVTTGQLYDPVIKGRNEPSVEFRLGADVAHVWSSKYLTGAGDQSLEPVRFRGRAGVQLSAPQADLFYGVSWLSPEFEGQTEGQLVGSLNVNLRF